MQGNTAPYLQYAVARIHSIFRKAQKKPSAFVKSETPPSTNSEKKLSRKLCFFPIVIGVAGSLDWGTHHLEYLEMLRAAGIATLESGKIKEVKCEGRVDALENNLSKHKIDGNVGIGTNAPAHKLEVSGGGGGTFGAITNRQSANANTDGIATVNYNGGNNSLRLWVDASGNRYLNAGTTAVISFTTTAVNITKATTFSSGRATFSGTAGADGVVLAPSAFSNTLACVPSIIATQEFVVPRSIPITLLII